MEDFPDTVVGINALLVPSQRIVGSVQKTAQWRGQRDGSGEQERTRQGEARAMVGDRVL